MKLNRKTIGELDRITRLKIINAVTGIKPANLIATVNNDGLSNVAIFSSVIHLGSNPPLLGFIMRPQGDVHSDTYRNIMDSNQYTINHIHPDFVEKAHYTSAKFDTQISEFKRCNLTEFHIDGFKAPFVKESTFKMGLIFQEEIKIPLNGTSLIIGEIEELIIPENAINEDFDIDLSISKTVGISGLNSYYNLTKIADYPYVNVGKIPSF